MYRQREVVLIPFPYTGLTGAKQRPALIISNDRLNGTDKICCLVTSKETSEGILLKTQLPLKSWVKPHRVFTVHKSIIRKSVGEISSEQHREILEKLGSYIE